MTEGTSRYPASPDASAHAERPLSPHLQAYKIFRAMTSGMSIFHRFTGIGLAGGLVVMSAWLVCLAAGPEPYNAYIDIATSPIGRFLFFGWTWILFYHLGCGVRHLMWDAGRWLSLKAIYLSGYVVLAFSALMTLGLWGIILWR